MAKRDDSSVTKSKMTVMIFQMEGSDETLQEGLRKISQAVENVIRPPQRALTAPKPPPPPTLTENADIERPVNEEIEREEDDGDGESSATASSTTPRKKPVVRTPVVVSPLGTVTPNISLEEFCKQKNVGDAVADRYLVSMLWLRDQALISEVTMDHVYTCFKLQNWPMPRDPGQMLRSLKHDGFLDKGEATGSYKINHIGENDVNKPRQ